MKHTLTLTGSAAALAAAMAAFESIEQGNAISTPIGAGTPVAPAFPPSVPSSVAPIPTAPTPPTDQDDEDGDASDGTGLDSAGLPWDERIHSSSKKRGKDGTWNKRRSGPSGAELAAIEQELRGGAAPAPMPAPAAPVEQSAEWDFTSFMNAAAPKFGEGEGQLSTDYLSQVCQAYGIASITDAAPNPELLGKLVAQFQVDGRW